MICGDIGHHTVFSNTEVGVGGTQQKAFNKVQKMIHKEAILAFLNFNEEVVIYTDATKFQVPAWRSNHAK
jgi:hypothetical protein